MKKFYTLLLISVISIQVYSQSSKLPPSWVNNPQQFSNDTYYCVSGSGNDRRKARDDAEMSILSYYNNELSKSVNTELNQTQRSYYDIVAKETMKVVSSSFSYGLIRGIQIKGYWENPTNNIVFCLACLDKEAFNAQQNNIENQVLAYLSRANNEINPGNKLFYLFDAMARSVRLLKITYIKDVPTLNYLIQNILTILNHINTKVYVDKENNGVRWLVIHLEYKGSPLAGIPLKINNFSGFYSTDAEGNFYLKSDSYKNIGKQLVIELAWEKISYPFNLTTVEKRIITEIEKAINNSKIVVTIPSNLIKPKLYVISRWVVDGKERNFNSDVFDAILLNKGYQLTHNRTLADQVLEINIYTNFSESVSGLISYKSTAVISEFKNGESINEISLNNLEQCKALSESKEEAAFNSEQCMLEKLKLIIRQQF